MNNNGKRILLIYPKMGMGGIFVQHQPLGILYAAVDPIKAGFTVDILDVRLRPDNWQQDIAAKITPDTILLGLSVMTGAPIRNALEITRWARQNYPHLKIVWGGPHATFQGRQIMDQPEVDFAISSYGTLPLALLARNLSGDSTAPRFEEIKGLLFRSNGTIVQNPTENSFEFIHYKDIPYDLIKDDFDSYGQLDNTKQRIFSMFSVMGCPYKCTFCSSPAQYKDIKKKYVTIAASEVVDHIEYLQKEYGATYIYFIDDDSFANLAHVENIIDEMNNRKIKIGLGFRGARINEIKRMSDAYLDKLAAAGTNIMHIGAESGSQRILDLIKKDCTPQDIIECNRKLARHPQIKTAYNWIVGLPTETIDDLIATRKLIMTLVKDNPNAIIFVPNKFRLLPGTVLYDLAIQHGYVEPKSIEDWIERESEGDYRPPWYTNEQANMINMMQITSYFIDNKVHKVETGDTLKFKLARLLAHIYAPMAKLRFKYGISGLLFEYQIFYWFTSSFRK